MRLTLVVSLIYGTGWFVVGASAAPFDSAPAATQPAATQPVAELVRQLGDPDPSVRDRATRALWTLGHAAETDLRAAAAGDDPEIARRARSVLRDFTYGLYPDAPREVFVLLEEYRKGDAGHRRMAVLSLAGQGVPGLRVLLKLRHDERDPLLRQTITQVLNPREHQVAVLMLADGQDQDLQQMLQQSWRDSLEAAQDYAALLLLDGKIRPVLEKLKAQPITPQSAPLIVPIARAAGDGAFALDAAEHSGNPDLVDAVLVEQGNWDELAQRVMVNPERMSPTERLGYSCAYYRLAGKRGESEKAAAELVAHAAAAPNDYMNCVENLLLNDHPEEATDILIAHNNYLEASSFLGPRLDFAKALELPRLAEQRHAANAIEVKARSLIALHFIGEIDKATELMKQLASANQTANDFAVWGYLIEAAREMGLKQQIDDYAAAALAKPGPQASIGWLFEKMGLGEGPAAARWWQFLRHQYGTQSVADSLGRLRAVFDRSIDPAELGRMSGEARRYASELPDADRDAWEESFGATLQQAGLIDAAADWYRELARRSKDPQAMIQAGDFEASRKNWTAAGDYYAKAWDHDHTLATALFLHGWATAQGGDEAEGRQQMDLAHRLPLGDAPERVALMEALIQHGLHEDARREIELILKATSVRSWERNEAMRRGAEDIGGQGNEIAAADMWDRAFLANLGDNISFGEPWVNVMVPALIHKTRAVGLAKAGKIDQAMEEATLALKDTPSDADALIDVVTAMDKAGHPAEADALFKKQTAIYRKLISDYPKSGPAHNQLAWSQVKCNRELDDALTNARRAVELEPTATASIDTLAEVYFTRGDIPKAIEQMKRCIELEPHVERHQKQLARFKAALKK